MVTAYEAQRQVDLLEVASNELMSIPISIFDTSGAMRTGSKSAFAQSLVPERYLGPLPEFDNAEATVIIDAMARVQAIGLPKRAHTFGDLADTFVASIFATGQCFHRIEVVGDRYRAMSIKDATRIKRSKNKAHPGIRRSIDSCHVSSLLQNQSSQYFSQ